jgi:sec-independent protein translocase protein TatA
MGVQGHAVILGIGAPELIIVLIIFVLLFGGKLLPKLSKNVGESVDQMKKTTGESDNKNKKSTDSNKNS